MLASQKAKYVFISDFYMRISHALKDQTSAMNIIYLFDWRIPTGMFYSASTTCNTRLIQGTQHSISRKIARSKMDRWKFYIESRRSLK
jgi:hypothetical protein